MNKRLVEVVGAIIENEENEILCALRSDRMPSTGFWEFPGGKMEQGETIQQTIVREIKEELNCEISPQESIYDDYTYEYEHLIVRLITVKCKIISGEPVPTEHEKLEWVKKPELMKLNWLPADISTIEKLMKE